MDQLAHQLVSAFEQKMKRDGQGYLFAPDDYTIHLHPRRLALWQSQPDILEQFVAILESAADEAHARFAHQPGIHLQADPSLPEDGSRVESSFRLDNVEHTATIPVQPEPVALQESGMVIKAFLIINGVDVVYLDQPVVNIGRRPDNHLVLNDTRVSRSHAQIRNINGSYILFDLNSTGGTYVNQERITQSILQPGDVISLAGLNLIYGEDTPPSQTPPEGSTTEIS